MYQTDDRNEVFTVASVGRTRTVTPEGYLYCRDVVLARTGVMHYEAREVPWLKAGADGSVSVYVGDDVLFSSDTMASFEGKDVTDGHPPKLLTTDTSSRFSKGVILNVHRGTGDDSDKLMADLLIKDGKTIDDIQQGKVGLSNGYDSDYQQISPGSAIRTKVVGNHAALTDSPRCGPLCSIGDSKMGMQWKEKILAAFGGKDDRALKAALDEMPDQQATNASAAAPQHVTNIHLGGADKTKDADPPGAAAGAAEGGAKPAGGGEDPIAKIMAAITSMGDRLTKLEGGKSDTPTDPAKDADDPLKGGIKVEAEKGAAEKPNKSDDPPLEVKTKDDGEANKQPSDDPDKKDKKATGDSQPAFDASEIQATKARAEILVPGVVFPTFDAKALNAATALCNWKRKVIQRAMTTDSTLVPGVKDVSKMSCDAVSMAFVYAADAMAKKNMAKIAPGAAASVTFASKTATQIADINARNAKFWEDRKHM